MTPRNNFPIPALVAAAALLLLAGCDSRLEPGRSPAAEVYSVVGIYLETKGEKKNVAVIDHEEIPGYMRAMVMPFKAADPAELEGLTAGDEIQFDYIVDKLSSWIENVKKTGKRREPGGSARIPAPAEPAAERLTVGQILPNYAFTNENGEAVALSDHRGRAVALTFIFTRCPVPEYCPRMMMNFDAVSDALADGPDNWQLLTISFDSTHDTPERMKAYGAQFGHEPGNWNLLTSDSIDQIAANVDLRFGETESGSFQHNLRTVVLDTTGRITRIFTDETWKVEDLAAAIRDATHPAPADS